MNDVVRATVKQHNKTPGKMEWRVLIVDEQSMRMVSACTKMHELSTEGITSNFKFPIKYHWLPMRYTKIFFSLLSCWNHRKKTRTVANYGMYLFDHTFWKKCQSSDDGFSVTKSYSVPSCPYLLHRRYL